MTPQASATGVLKTDRDSLRRQAVILAAAELLPAEWQDLSSLLQELRGSGPEAIVGASDVPQLSKYSADLLAYLQAGLNSARVEHWQERLARFFLENPGVSFASAVDGDYPANLKASYNRPPYLFYLGSLVPKDAISLAIVGSRAASRDVLEQTRGLAYSASAAGICIVSGLARGVDEAAHLGALDAGGRTIGVVGSAMDRVLGLSDSTSLASRVTASGAILSPFPPASPSTKSSLPLRNAVISGLSRASLVMAATERSGTRSEVDHALRQDRRVLFWKPTMGQEDWAHALSQSSRLVDWVDSPQEIEAAVMEGLVAPQ